MSRNYLNALLVCLALGVRVQSGWADLIQFDLTDSSLADGGNLDPSAPQPGFSYSFTTLPVPPGGTNTFTTTSNGAASSVFNISDADFNISFSQTKAKQTTDFGDALESTGAIYFTPTVPVSYTASGTYSFSSNGPLEFFSLTVALLQLPDSGGGAGSIGTLVEIFQSNQIASGSSGPLTLAGDPTLFGSLTGLLTPGVNYEYVYDAVADPFGLGVDNSATGQGTVDISFSAASLPEPASLAGLLVMGAGLLARRGRRTPIK